MKKSKMNNNEIIILSIVIGVFIALIMGYAFSQSYDINYRGIKVYGKKGDYSEFNYLLSFGSFIIVAGISYLFLNKRKKTDKNMIDEPKEKEIDSYSLD